MNEFKLFDRERLWKSHHDEQACKCSRYIQQQRLALLRDHWRLVTINLRRSTVSMLVFFSPGMLTCLSAFGKQNEVLNQGWRVANQVFKALEKGKGVEAFYVGVVKVINRRG